LKCVQPANKFCLHEILPLPASEKGLGSCGVAAEQALLDDFLMFDPALIINPGLKYGYEDCYNLKNSVSSVKLPAAQLPSKK